MARAFYGDRFSPNMTKTPEGFLICHNVPIARTGTQDYLPKELGLEGAGLIHVHRYAEDVFSKDTLASFEGKPVTDDHPRQTVDSTNYSAYMKGITQNVRRDGETIVADLVIHDSNLIAEIEAGKREISCGYDCNYVKDGNDYKQTNIIGNHVAIVTHGRAGHAISIKDADSTKGGIKSMKKKNILMRMFEAFSKDAEPEDILKASRFVNDEDSDEEKDKEKEPAAKDEDCKEDTKDSDIAEIKETVDSLSRVVAKLVEYQLNNQPAKRSALDELEEELAEDSDEEIEEKVEDEDEEHSEESREADPETIDEDTTEESKPEATKDKAIALSVIRQIKPIIASLPVKQRRKANDELSKAIRKALGNKDTQPLVGGYGALVSRKKATDSAANLANLKAFGENCRKRNPHCK